MRIVSRATGLFAMLLLAACHSDDHSTESHDQGHAEDHGGGHGHGASSHAITHWTNETELFVEFPALVVGQESPFAAHLTRLSDFQPIDAGKVVAVLSGGGKPEERFEIASPQVPGIFRPVAQPQHAGTRALSIRLESEALTVTHEIGNVTVYVDAAAARHDGGEHEEPPGLISFLKEQQWRIEFATTEVGPRTMRPSLAVHGTVRARSDGEVRVTAPVPGRLTTVGNAFPHIGASVEQDEALVALAPRLGAGVDVATLELAVARARLDVGQARREKERLEGLLADGAVAERRVVAATHAERRAQAELTAAESRLQLHGRVHRASGVRSAGGITIRAPITGTIVGVEVAPGAFLEEGQEMFHIVNLDRLWLEVQVPEANIGRLENTVGAWFEVEGFEDPFEVTEDNVVTIGGLVDPRTRTVPLILAIDNPNRRLRVGMFARVHVLTGTPANTIAIPVAAVVGDGGQDVAYVQVEGESFERRILRLGIRDGDYVEVIKGIQPGEHLVVRGAFAVKLAASGSAVPAHGHAH